MTDTIVRDTERSVARCRVILSMVTLISLCLESMPAVVPRWLFLSGGPAVFDPRALALLVGHLGYSLLLYHLLITRPAFSSSRLVAATTWNDTVFAAAIAVCTGGAASPFYAFFIFAVLVTGFRSGMRRTLIVTAIGVVSYVTMIALSPPGRAVYITRPAYLAIIGYLAGYLGQRRLEREGQVGALEANQERARIGRELHDGCVQTLAAVNLSLASCQDLLRHGRSVEAFTDLAVLRASVTSEYDNLRAYMRSLAGVPTPAGYRGWAANPQWSFKADFTGSSQLVDHVLLILREAVVNVRRHADAVSAAIRVFKEGPDVCITIDDNGTGLRPNAQLPWSLNSRVSELGGVIRIAQEGGPGAHLAIEIPQE